MKFKILIMIMLLSVSLYSQEVIDKIIAVVDDEIILKSEFDFQVNLLSAQKNVNPNTPGFKENVLNALIEEKLVFAQANLDSIIVSDEEVTQRIEYQVETFIQQYGSKEKVEQIYGMSIEKIKREMRDDVRKNLMIQRLREQNFSTVEASRREVEEFFVKYKIDNRWSLKTAYQFLFIEYKTETVKQRAPDGTLVDRFRNKANTLGLGVSYNFLNNPKMGTYL